MNPNQERPSFAEGPIQRHKPDNETEKGGTPNFTLLISKMEEEILNGKNRAACIKTLGKEDIWKQVNSDEQLQWARLAQMAGEVETALKVLAWLNRAQPEWPQPWLERLELLHILDRREELIRVLSESRRHLDEETQRSWLQLTKLNDVSTEDSDVDAAAAPFARLKHRQMLISHYLELFSGREDCFARQWADRQQEKQGYVPVRRPMEPQDAEEHLSGRRTYGLYLMRSDATVRVAVIDVDINKQYRQGRLKPEEKSHIKREYHYLVTRISEMAGQMGLIPLQEFSGGKGFHFWFLFASALEAGRARSLLGKITSSIKDDVSAFKLEVFPKQTRLGGKGLGNLVKLPLGVHRVTGNASYFTKCHDRSVDAQLEFLAGIRPCRIEEIHDAGGEAGAEKVLVHPRWKKWAGDFPELFKLQELCPPLAQIIAACRNGKELSLREQKVLFQTVGFLASGKTLLQHLFAFSSDYNPHLVDFKLSRLRGTPLGCKRIHSLLQFTGDLCAFKERGDYAHPLLHLGPWEENAPVKTEKVENLASALNQLKTAIAQTERFMR